MDLPRDEAISAVQTCLRAGIQVKMITGDHVATAAAIARQIGLQGVEDERDRFAISGHRLAELPDHELLTVVEQASVSARVSPEQKRRKRPPI